MTLICELKHAVTFYSQHYQSEPPPSWLRAFEAASRPLLDRDEVNPQALSLIMWSIAKLGFRPGIDWMESMIQVRSLMYLK